MKKITIITLMLISFCAYPTLSHADYIIHLKHGGQFMTPKYWADDDQIHFFVRGGTMGIEKDSVQQIEKSTVEAEYVYETKKSSGPPVTEDKSSATAVKGEAKKEDAKTEKPSSDPNKDPAITNEFQQLQKNFAGRHRLSIDELNTLKSDLIAFSNKISAQKLEDNFAEEFTLANDMSFHVNNLLIIKKRQR